ncbi:hypothetical protein LWC34_52585 [Kibdelosporangium philippinense]|uniref:Uncharacterized protein n=1 Tax=Kibdelosporangium philippinense TaxID=211113 RepID=A0ABS8ZUY1_9PSEU|nr:hypothetical protein [Kibdelosporangium philippinense]MCE7011394.1 hypothetical protein [Kibdelosporangium philippinense]
MTTFDPKDRKHDEAQQVDVTDRDHTDRPRADRTQSDRARTDRDEVRGQDRTGQAELGKHDKGRRQTDEPDVRAEQARTPETRTLDTQGAENQAPVAARSKLFEETEAEQYRMQWREVQSNFVDEPRAAVREAETLVSQMMDSLTTQLNEQKRALKSGADGDDTEQLRVAMQRYRSLFDQMLQV